MVKYTPGLSNNWPGTRDMFQKEHADRMASAEPKQKKQVPKALSAQNGGGGRLNGGKGKKTWPKKQQQRPCLNCDSREHQSNNPACPNYEKYLEYLTNRRNEYLVGARDGDSDSIVKAKKAEVLIAKSKYEKQLRELTELKSKNHSHPAHLLLACTRSQSVSGPPSGFEYESPYDLHNMACLNLDCSLHNMGECKFASTISDNFCEHTKINAIALMARADNKAEIFSSTDSEFSKEEPNPIALKSSSATEREVLRAIMDSGASDHFINDLRLFAEYKKQPAVPIETAGGVIYGTGRGHIPVETPLRNAYLKNVIHCSDLNENLLSILALDLSGHHIVIENKTVKVLHGEREVLRGKMANNRLYYLDLQVPYVPK